MADPSPAPERELVFNRIPLLRADRGLSRGELAEALGIHYQTVGYIERGEYSPSLHLAMRIARLLRAAGRGGLLARPVRATRRRRAGGARPAPAGEPR